MDISSTFKRPAKGFATRLLERYTPHREGRDRVIEDMTYVSCGFTLCVAQTLYRTRKDELSSLRDDNPLECPRDEIDNECLFNAARFLFDIPENVFSERLAYEYKQLFTKRDFYKISKPPSSLATIFTEWTTEKDGTDY
jgi:hypothetical protein